MQKKKFIIITMCIAIGIMVIGYAAFSTSLNINGTANIASTWKVVFTNIEEASKTSGVTITTAPTASGTTATFNVDLRSPGDNIVYQVTVENQGTLDAIINDIQASETGSDAIKFEINGVQIGDKLAKGTTTTFLVTIRYDSNVTSQPNILVNNLTININYIQDTGQVITPSTPTIVPTLLSRKILYDNAAQSDESIDFSAISSDTNGKGLYYTSTNTEDNKVTYYFRGDVTNNYVYFAGFYWRIIRINEDGSVRLIYQGTTATATNWQTHITDVAFNTNSGDNAFVGYMYGTPTTYTEGVGNFSGWVYKSTTGTVKMSTAYTFDSSTGVFTLTDPIDGYYSEDYYEYYTCMHGSNTVCTFMMKITEARISGSNYQLLAGETHSGYYSTSYSQATTNTESSKIKTTLEDWYQKNLLSYASYLSDSGFCNDRSVTSGLGYGMALTRYGVMNRLYTNKTPQFACPKQNDLFTVSNIKGNSDLIYPIGLITADEVAYAGGVWQVTNNSYYLYTGSYYYTMSPYNLSTSTFTSVVGVSGNGGMQNSYVYSGNGVRPVINLKSSVEITSGDGTIGNPYTINED